MVDEKMKTESSASNCQDRFENPRKFIYGRGRRFVNAFGVPLILGAPYGPLPILSLMGNNGLIRWSILWEFYISMGWASLIVFAWLAIVLWTYFVRFKEYRPIVTSDNEIVAEMFGRPWRSVRWSEVSKIEKIEDDAPDGSHHRIKIRVISQFTSVEFINSIGGFDELMKIIDTKINQPNVPTVYTDDRFNRLDSG